MSADKKRNFFIIAAIMLTTFMIATVFSIGISIVETQKKQQLALMGTTAHAAVTRPTAEQLEKMAKLPYIKEYGVGNHVAYVKSAPEMGDVNLSLFTFDKTSWDKMRAPAYDDIVGSFPQKENEVMFPLWVFEQMGIDNPQIGMESDFELKNNTANIVNEEKKQKFTSEFLTALREIPGFKDMQTTSETMGYIEYSEQYEPYLKAQFEREFSAEEMKNISDFFSSIIVGIDPAFLEEYSKTLESPFDAAAFDRGEYVLLSSKNPELLMGIEDINFRSSNERAPTKLDVGGTVPQFFAGAGYSAAPTIICSNRLLNKLYENPIIGKISIHVEKGFDVEALEVIKNLMGDDKEISCTSVIETREEFKQVQISMYIFGGGIALIIGLIGVMNFINIVSVSIMVRKRELAILESVGMSKKHMKKMLVWEGGWYAILTLAIVSSLGSLVSYGIFTLFKQEADYVIFAYPIIPVLIVSAIVANICIFAPQKVYRSISHSTLVERLRETE